MKTLLNSVISTLDRQEGQALAEYALIVAFIAAACVISLGALGLVISGAYTSIIGSF